jgi:hypothetical protein
VADIETNRFYKIVFDDRPPQDEMETRINAQLRPPGGVFAKPDPAVLAEWKEFRTYLTEKRAQTVQLQRRLNNGGMRPS